jgi:RHS repeat-associated protein
MATYTGNYNHNAQENTHKVSLKLDELYMYGSSRIGSVVADQVVSEKTIHQPEYDGQRFGELTWGPLAPELAASEVEENLQFYGNPTSYTLPPFSGLRRGQKRYELSNHLGNVLVVITDRKLPVGNAAGVLDYFQPFIRSIRDYEPFGSELPGRGLEHKDGKDYKFGFNGQEQEAALGEYYVFEYRIHDARLGRFLSVDPFGPMYAWSTTFSFAANAVIQNIDFMGLYPVPTNVGSIDHAVLKTLNEKKIFADYVDRTLNELLVKNQAPNGGNVANGAGRLLKMASFWYMLLTPSTMMESEQVWMANQTKTLSSLNTRGKINRLKNESSRFFNEFRIYTTDYSILPEWYFNMVKQRVIGGGADYNDLLQYRDFLRKSGKELIVEDGMSSALKRYYRQMLAMDYMQNWSEVDYVDADHPVQEIILKKGTVLLQYRVRNPDYKGYFYAPVNTKPEDIGLLTKDVARVWKVVLDKDVKVLSSRHVKDAPVYYNNQEKAPGGGVQYYSREVKDASQWTILK